MTRLGPRRWNRHPKRPYKLYKLDRAHLLALFEAVDRAPEVPVSERIRTYRVIANLYVQEAAETLNVSRESVYRWEDGTRRPPVSVVHVLRCMARHALGLAESVSRLDVLDTQYHYHLSQAREESDRESTPEDR